VKVGDLVTIRDEWRTLGIYYGIGVITMMDDVNATYTFEDDTDAPIVGCKSFRVQWNDDFTWHTPEELELISKDS